MVRTMALFWNHFGYFFVNLVSKELSEVLGFLQQKKYSVNLIYICQPLLELAEQLCALPKPSVFMLSYRTNDKVLSRSCETNDPLPFSIRFCSVTVELRSKNSAFMSKCSRSIKTLDLRRTPRTILCFR